MSPARVTVVRGHQMTPWELRPWAALDPARFRVSALATAGNPYDATAAGVGLVDAPTWRDALARGPLRPLGARLPVDRYRDLDPRLAGSDIVHVEELSYWFSAQVARARARRRGSFRLAVTVWETLPLLDAYRNPHARRWRAQVLETADLFLPATERARDALLLEGAPPDRIEVCPPGVDVERFVAAAAAASSGGVGAPGNPHEHLLISPGRLVWEKGHQDVLRALAALDRGLVEAPRAASARLLVVGAGPERTRLEAHAAELGLAGRVEFRSVPYDEMPALYARASCMVLASLPRAGCELPGSVPRCFWEEQFGYVLPEALAAGLPVLAARSGAIPEVSCGQATLFEPGDWLGLARALAAGPLSAPRARRATADPAVLERYGLPAAAARLGGAYERLLAG